MSILFHLILVFNLVLILFIAILFYHFIDFYFNFQLSPSLFFLFSFYTRFYPYYFDFFFNFGWLEILLHDFLVFFFYKIILISWPESWVLKISSINFYIFLVFFYKLIFFLSFDVRLLVLEFCDVFFFCFSLCEVILISYSRLRVSQIKSGFFPTFLNVRFSSFSLFKSWHLLFYSISSMRDYPGLTIRP